LTGRRGDAPRIADILRSIARVEEILTGGYGTFSESWILQSVVIRELEIIGEAAGEISLSMKANHPEVAWRRMRGFSSFGKHEYWRVESKLLWIAVEEMPALRKKIGRVSASEA
jgi:uncharacterized protein with HEPN domain